MQLVAALLVLSVWAGSVAAQGASAPADLDALVARGDSAWTRDDQAGAFRAYDAVVRADSAYSTRALFRVGLLHAWANRFSAAVSAQRRYVREEREDLEGRIALGRTYAWASRFPEALAQYDTVLAADTLYRDAVVGRAQALAWSDRIPEGEATLERWLTTASHDVEAWALLGQFRRWRGATREAKAALERALAISPENASAQEQMAWVRADLEPALQWQFVGAKDSEDNTLWHREVGLSFSGAGGLRYGVTARLREASVTDGGAVVVPGAVVHGLWRPRSGAVTWRGEAGMVAFPDFVPGSSTRLRGALRGSGVVAKRLRLSAGGSHEPFDEVRSTAIRGLMFTVFDLDATYVLTPRWQLGAAGSSGTANGEDVDAAQRNTLMAALRFLPRRGVQLALSHRDVRWDEPQFGVFFAPQTWSTTDLALSWERTAELGLILAGDLAVGTQGVAFENNPVDRSTVPRAAMRAGWRAAPGREILLGLVYANVAGAGAITASDYRYGAATLSGRWTF